MLENPVGQNFGMHSKKLQEKDVSSGFTATIRLAYIQISQNCTSDGLYCFVLTKRIHFF